MKKFTILAIVLWSVNNLFAFQSQLEPRIRIGEPSSIEQQTQHWLQNDDTEETSGSLRGGIGAGETPDGNLSVPVGEGLFALSLFAMIFAAVNKKRRSNKK